MYSLLSPLPFGAHLAVRSRDSTGSIQELQQPTWADVFTFLQSRHFHAEEGRTTPHTESLWDHLVTAGDIAYTKAQTLGLRDHEAKKAYFAAFLHDIGKPATLTRSSTHLAYKGHGLVGGAILENAWTPAIEEATGLTAVDWADISMLADCHMCGYFPHQCEYKHAVGFQILPESVKRILPCLRWADMAATTPTPSASVVTDPKADEERFMRTLLEPLDTVRLAKEKPRGILIQLCGASGAGKSTIGRWLAEQFEARSCKVLVVARDTYMVRESLKQRGLPTDAPWSPILYRECYDYYVGTGKAYSADINAAMKSAIAEALRKSYIVILDTLMTMYAGAVKSVLPESADKAFRLNLWVHRNSLMTEEEALGRLGMTLDEQLAVTGETGPCWNPFPAGLLWRTLVSATE